MGIQYNCSRFASSQCLLIPPATPHVRKRLKRNIQVNGERNSARGPYVLFLETGNTQGARAALLLFLGNETREKSGFVSYVSFSLCFDFDPNCALRIARTQSFTVAAFSTLIEAISISSAAEVRLRIS